MLSKSIVTQYRTYCRNLKYKQPFPYKTGCLFRACRVQLIVPITERGSGNAEIHRKRPNLSQNKVRVESRLTDGVVRGAYSYVDPTNKVIHVTYIADSDGYRVLSGNNLPTVPSAPASLVGPSPVDYTPEVAAARAEFEKIYNELAAKAAEEPSETDTSESKERRRRSVLLPALYTITPTSLKVKVNEAKEVTDVISPANTKPVEFSEVEKSFPITPFVVAPANLPFASSFYTYFYTI